MLYLELRSDSGKPRAEPMKANPQLSLRSLAEERELVPQEKPKLDPLVLSAVWGGKKSDKSKPPSRNSSTLMIDSPVWHTSTAH